MNMTKLTKFVALMTLISMIAAGCNNGTSGTIDPKPHTTHDWTSWETIIDPTCVEDGVKSRYLI